MKPPSSSLQPTDCSHVVPRGHSTPQLIRQNITDSIPARVGQKPCRCFASEVSRTVESVKTLLGSKHRPQQLNPPVQSSSGLTCGPERQQGEQAECIQHGGLHTGCQGPPPRPLRPYIPALAGWRSEVAVVAGRWWRSATAATPAISGSQQLHTQTRQRRQGGENGRLCSGSRLSGTGGIFFTLV